MLYFIFGRRTFDPSFLLHLRFQISNTT
uniref:Uncharacterized protein n=1 Tax=Rhizophora mucronata TaxID=61149 RepID=A0A2P2PL72_RHIMU